MKVTILVPENELPAEGADAEVTLGDEPGASELIDTYAALLGESSLAFRVSSDGSVALAETSPIEEFVYFDVGADGGEPVFSAVDGAEAVPVDLAGVAASVTETSDADTGLRQLVEHLSAGLHNTVPEGRGTPVPLVRWHGGSEKGDNGDGGGGIAQLLGIWLAEEGELRAFRDGAGDHLIVFEDGDVAGHGIREAAAALAVFGVMLGGAAKAEAGFLFFKSKAERQAGQQTRAVPSRSGQRPAVMVTDVVAKARAGKSRVIVDVSKQRAYLVSEDGSILIDTPVSTARAGKHTPRGEFKITQRVRTGKRSTIYGCSLPYWMRLDQSAIGLHVGDLPGHPASAGCVRLPAHVAPVLFDATRSGTTVKVVDSWLPQPGLYAGG